jgi:predicted dithiol-disulfide oxidoreductase (DUF899 family)
MNDQAPSPALPPVVDRKTWQEAREALFAREKAHTREGDAIAAAAADGGGRRHHRGHRS